MKTAQIGICTLFLLAPLGAATFTVNSTTEVADANAGDGACATGNLLPDGQSQCTLRAAIQESNASPAFPTTQIILPSGNYVLTVAALSIDNSVTIAGSGATTTIVDGGGLFTVFRISNTGTNPIVNMSNITIRNGQSGIGNGAGILNSSGCSLSLNAVVIRDNRSAVGGVGIANAGSLTLRRSTVRDNQITGGGGGVTGTGGGIFNFTGANADIIESTISGNLGIRGGGISNGGSMDIINSTISGNKASAGGGIRNAGSGVVNIAYSTITNNEAGVPSGEPLGNRVGGGLLNFATVNMANSILAANLDGRLVTDPLYSPDCSSETMFGFTSFRGNVVGVVNGTCLFGDTIFGAPPPFDLVGTNASPLDPGLNALGNNGGLAQTHPLKSTSPAVDNGTGITSSTFFDCHATDQRGFHRPADGDLDGVARCDVGAYEFRALSPADVNGDGNIDCFDVARVKSSFGKKSGDIGFDAKADVNGDNVVDVKDLAFVAQQLPGGTSCQ